METTTTTQTDLSLDERRRLTLAMHEAAAVDDFDTVLATYDPGIVWINGPGAGPWAGRFEGVEAVATMFVEFMTFLEGTFTTEVVDVCVSEDRAVSLLLEHASKDGVEFENQAVWITRFDGDKVVEVTAVDLDQDGALAFWAAVGADAVSPTP
ncbi:MAG: nuclear transport factor 2 family protein [Actinobacteria bacterium]|nr:nuclear transport factor 2 family protein [Actinomycetota bacterium]